MLMIAHKFFKLKQYSKAKEWIENSINSQWNNMDALGCLIIIKKYLQEGSD